MDRFEALRYAAPVIRRAIEERRLRAESAATFKHDFKIPYVDAIAAALTRELSSGSPKEWATLVTADFDFKNLPTASIQIEYLPAKKKVPTKQART